MDYAMECSQARTPADAVHELTLVNIGVNTNRDGHFEEAIAAYPPALPETTARTVDGPIARIDAARDAAWDAACQLGRPFVLGAVAHGDGTIGLHS